MRSSRHSQHGHQRARMVRGIFGAPLQTWEVPDRRTAGVSLTVSRHTAVSHSRTGIANIGSCRSVGRGHPKASIGRRPGRGYRPAPSGAGDSFGVYHRSVGDVRGADRRARASLDLGTPARPPIVPASTGCGMVSAHNSLFTKGFPCPKRIASLSIRACTSRSSPASSSVSSSGSCGPKRAPRCDRSAMGSSS